MAGKKTDKEKKKMNNLKRTLLLSSAICYIYLSVICHFYFLTVPRRRMVPLCMCWSHTRDKIQGKVVLSNMQTTTTRSIVIRIYWVALRNYTGFQVLFFLTKMEAVTIIYRVRIVMEMWSTQILTCLCLFHFSSLSSNISTSLFSYFVQHFEILSQILFG